jgi:hypothetical protein
MISQKKINPKFTKTAFWDVDIKKIDYQKHRLFVMEKVLNYGLWEDFIILIKFYGKKNIKKEIVNASYLNKDVMSFVCLIFNLRPEDFKCYSKIQFQKKLWGF